MGLLGNRPSGVETDANCQFDRHCNTNLNRYFNWHGDSNLNCKRHSDGYADGDGHHDELYPK